MALPGVLVVCLFDSMSKEPFGPKLYLSATAAIVIVSFLGGSVISLLRTSTDEPAKPAASTSTIASQALNQATLSIMLVTGAVVIWLFLIGH
jgi:hypothetical protein